MACLAPPRHHRTGSRLRPLRHHSTHWTFPLSASMIRRRLLPAIGETRRSLQAALCGAADPSPISNAQQEALLACLGTEQHPPDRSESSRQPLPLALPCLQLIDHQENYSSHHLVACRSALFDQLDSKPCGIQNSPSHSVISLVVLGLPHCIT